MSFPRRHPAQHGSGAASSVGASSSSNAMLSWAYETVPPRRPSETGTTVEAHQFGYTAVVPSVPLPPVNPPGPSMEAYPLQSELSQNHRVLHTHIFKEVIPPPQSGQGSPHRGKIANDRMTIRTAPLEPMGKSQNPKWKTTLQ